MHTYIFIVIHIHIHAHINVHMPCILYLESVYVMYLSSPGSSLLTPRIFVYMHTFAGTLRCMFETSRIQYDKFRAEANETPTEQEMPKAVEKLLSDKYHVYKDSSRYTVELDSDNRYKATVKSLSSNTFYISDLSKHKDGIVSCSCGQPLISGLPDRHNVAHAAQIGLRVMHIADSRFTTAGLQRSYRLAGEFGQVRITDCRFQHCH